MYIAKCTEDGVSYAAVDFSRLPHDEIGRKRRFLVCLGCGGPAYFMKASKSGRSACFGARPHAEGCDEAAPKYETDPDGRGEDQEQLHNPAERIVVDLRFGTGTNPGVKEDADLHPNHGRRGRFQPGGARPNAETHRRLSSLLRHLMEIEGFSQSKQILDIDEYGEFIFRPLLDASEEHSGLFRGYWGMLTDAQLDSDDTLWLNSRGRYNISFCIDPQSAAELFNRYGIQDEEELAGAYILAMGKVRVSANGKIYCPLNEEQLYTLRLVR